MCVHMNVVSIGKRSAMRFIRLMVSKNVGEIGLGDWGIYILKDACVYMCCTVQCKLIDVYILYYVYERCIIDGYLIDFDQTKNNWLFRLIYWRVNSTSIYLLQKKGCDINGSFVFFFIYLLDRVTLPRKHSQFYLKYFLNNLTWVVTLLNAMMNCKTIYFYYVPLYTETNKNNNNNPWNIHFSIYHVVMSVVYIHKKIVLPGK